MSDVVVTGLVSGCHQIEDIQVVVPYKVAVRIPAEAALRSKDLWRGIQQGRIFQLDMAPITSSLSSVPSQDKKLAKALEDRQRQIENLSEQNNALAEQNRALQDAVGGLQAKVEAILASLGRLESRSVSVGSNGGSGKLPEVVGGEIPAFIPTRIRDETIEANIGLVTEEVSGDSVLEAASKLRALKKQSSI